MRCFCRNGCGAVELGSYPGGGNGGGRYVSDGRECTVSSSVNISLLLSPLNGVEAMCIYSFARLAGWDVYTEEAELLEACFGSDIVNNKLSKPKEIEKSEDKPARRAHRGNARKQNRGLGKRNQGEKELV